MVEACFLRCKKSGRVLAIINKPIQESAHGDFELLKANSVDAATEKHVPVVERSGNTITVSVGSVEHPMTEEHLIEFIALATPTGMQIRYLTPSDKPVATFELEEGTEAIVYEFCNLHGLWKTEL